MLKFCLFVIVNLNAYLKKNTEISCVVSVTEASYPKIRTKIIEADFTSEESLYEKIRHELQDLEVGTLSKSF
jgi:hypothetical protein